MDFFGQLEYQKTLKKFSKNIDKTPYIRVAQKRYNFAKGVANHTFFTHPVFIIMSWNIAGRR